ncbi:formate dehydrogenase subunit beta [Paracoccus aerodenitrificans]|uniref:formate dehydrogenase subunit beta n=1 Tax=Paracoccus aerodenitrificans TaxID=3017781 RepID=UPI0022F06328|nr:formate dehydrogenase subunit beta [Paracoccus aerodenitrificans]WBU65413.1 formate dehydrogenase subunit beta [Paracoccus aerodenitrificans]
MSTNPAPAPRTAVSNPPIEPMAPNLTDAAIMRASATPDLPEPTQQMEKVAKLIDISKCIGCKACQSACIEWNDTHPEIGTNIGSYDNPHDLTSEMYTLMRFSEWEDPETGDLEWLIRKDGCMHCEDPGCLKACPSPGAIVQYTNGIVDFIHDKCIGCGYCIQGCPFDIPRMSPTRHVVSKCTLCSDRVAVGQGPACAKACPTQAIVFGTKDDMVAHAETRIDDLKSRGYDNAAIYDPQGVGGTHVFYVLPIGDKPELYSDLPADPEISNVVEGWKGPTKTIGLAAIGLGAAGAILHSIFGKPNTVSAEDQSEAEELVDEEMATAGSAQAEEQA